MATALDQSTVELANALALSDIPIKLRCAACNRLALNAFKLPCCDQSICASCQSTLPDTCPVCMHSPLDGSTCAPNKSLRLTVRAFLKSEEKKRGKTSTPVQAVPLPPSEAADVAPTDEKRVFEKPENDQRAASQPKVQIEEAAPPSGGDSDALHAPGSPALTLGQLEATEGAIAAESQVDMDEEIAEEDAQEEQEVEIHTGDDSKWTPHTQDDQSQQSNPMTQMQIPNSAFGGFNNMMGMPGMGMGMPNMFGGFNGMGMMNDMSAMNMNMNMNMGMGMGNFGGWNPQQMGGTFGFFPNGGFNQPGSFGNQMRQTPNQNYANRFRGRGASRPFGRGRGQFRGRGNFHQQNNFHENQQGWTNNQVYENFHGGHEQSVQDIENDRENGPDYTKGSHPVPGEPATEQAPESQTDEAPYDRGQHPTPQIEADQSQLQQRGDLPSRGIDGHRQDLVNGDTESPDQRVDAPNGNIDHIHGDGQRQISQSAEPKVRRGPSPPINAPTGPKAMRQPPSLNGATSSAYPRDSRRGSAATSAEQVRSHDDSQARDEVRNERHRERSRERDRRKRDRSTSRSSRHEEGHRRHREKRHRHEDEHEDRDSRKRATKDDRERGGERRSETPDEIEKRHRAEKDHHRSSRRDRDRSRDERRRDRSSSRRDSDRRSSKYDDEDYERERRRRHKREAEREQRDKHDERSDESERRRADRRERESKRSRRRERSPAADDLSRRIEASRRKHHTQDEQIKEKVREVMAPPSDEIGFKIKGSRNAARRESASDVPPTPPTGPKSDRVRTESVVVPATESRRGSITSTPATPVDPYAQEREARQKERMLREQKRRESATHGKRSGATEFDPPTGPRADAQRGGKGERRMSYRFEDEGRAMRGEREREGGRWE